MTTWTPIILGSVALFLVGLLALRYIRSLERKDTLRALMGQRYSEDSHSGSDAGEALEKSLWDVGEEEGHSHTAERRSGKSAEPTIVERLFYAGFFSQEQQRDFRRLQVVLPTAFVILLGVYGATTSDSLNILIYGIVGGMLGIYIPLNRLDKWRKVRDEEIMFYLPLVIEQIAIGVSSSLDIGPCLARVVQMADERDSHNPVTELLRFVQAYIKSGVSLQDALLEVGRQSGNNDVKHTFKALAQVARYGGEISKQLQDLSEATASARESKVDEKIKKLELSATGPVALVFAGFLIILLIGFGITIQNALG